MVTEHWLDVLEEYFCGAESLASYSDIGYWVRKRKEGRMFPFEHHLKALVYALLSNQRRWSGVEAKIDKINKLFFDFDKEEIKKQSPEYFIEGVFSLKCGNVATKRQMITLQDNIRILETLDKEFGSLDQFVTSASADEIVKVLSNSDSKYKLECVGVALAWEYLRNVGVDGAKPDTHLRRFLSSDRLGNGSAGLASEEEVISQVNEMSEKTGKEKWLIDALIWEYCNDGGAAICSSDPDCHRCVVRTYCKRKI